MKYFVYVVIAAVALMIVGGFFLIGSPREERMRRFDEQRVQSLQYIQSELVNYWQSKGKLPAILTDLNDDIRGFRVPVDPETGAQYDYEAKGDLDFMLCAEFSRTDDTFLRYSQESPPLRKGGYGIENWVHGAGRMCFDRHIDKDLYPPRTTSPIQ